MSYNATRVMSLAAAVAVSAVAATALAAVAALLAGWAAGGAGRPVAPRATSGWRTVSVPLAAQGPVSAALGQRDAEYAVTGGRARNPAQRLSVAFAPTGVAVRSGALRVRFGLTAYGRAGALRRVMTTAPAAHGNRVDYRHGAVDEWWTNGPLGLEQGFDIRSRPTSARGPLILSLALSGQVRARLTHAGLTLSGDRGESLRYGGLTATDERGRMLRSSFQLQPHRVVIHVDDRGATYPVRVDPFVQQAELSLSDGAAGDTFAAAAISADTLAVGAPGRRVGANASQGAVYVFERPAAGWAHATPVAQLTASDGAAGDELGATVAVSGDTIVAGAGAHKVGTNASQGAAYVFLKPASGWKDATQTAQLTASDGTTGERFPTALGVSDDTIVAGSFGHDIRNTDGSRGEAYAFVKPAAGWMDAHESAKLQASDGADADEFGISVAVSGETIVVGADHHKVAGNAGQGAAYVFAKPAGMTAIETEGAELTASDGGANDQFGRAVAISGDTIVAGAPNHQVGLSRQGSVYVFVGSLGGFSANTTQTAELSASDGVTDDGLGFAVATSGSTVVAGAFRDQVGANPFQGAAYVFARPGFVWGKPVQTETAELTAADGVTNDLFGIILGVSGNTIAVGGGLHSIGAPGSGKGAVYLFATPPEITIAAPASGATLTQGRLIGASFSCTAPPGATITSCAGPVANGAPLDTGSLGLHTFTVTAVDSDGATATRTVNYNVTASAGVGSTPPRITALRQSAAMWRRGGKLARLAGRRQAPVGTTFSFTVDQAAAVTLRFTTQTPGRMLRGHCVAPGADKRHAPRCTRTIAAGALTLTVHPGRSHVRFEGRVSRTGELALGRHTVQIDAVNQAGQRTTSRSLHFTIVK
jgi:hypothetical protein